MSDIDSANNSVIMDDAIIVNPVEYTAEKIMLFLTDDSILRSTKDRYDMAKNTLNTDEYSSLDNTNKNCVLIASMLSIFKDYQWENFTFNIDAFTNVSNNEKNIIIEILQLINNTNSADAYKLIPRYISLIIEYSPYGIINYIKNINEKELYSVLKEHVSDILKFDINSNNPYLNQQYNSNRNAIQKLNDYVIKNSSINNDIIENIFF